MFKRKNNSPKDSNYPIHKVPFSQKAYFGISIAGFTFIGSMIDGALLKFYVDFILFPALWFGIVQLLFAIINAINDPIIGYFSDRTKPVEGKGKRKIWLYRAIPLLGVGYFLIIFMNPLVPHIMIFIILIIGLALYDTGFAMHGINRGALIITVTDDDSERASIVSTSLVFQTILGIVSYLLILLFFTGFTPLPVLYIVFSFVGIIAVGVAFLGVNGIKEPSKLYYGQTFPKIKSLIKEVFKSKSFIFYMLLQFVVGAVTSTVITFQVFYFEDVVGVVGSLVALVSGITLPFTFFAYYMVQVVTKKLGPRKTLMIFLLMNIIAFLGLLLSRIFILSIIFYLIVNMGNAAFWILSSPIFGNVIDENELKTGNRNEGTFLGINAIFTSPSKSIMIFFFTLIITSMGYNGAAITQTEEAVLGIQLGTALIPIILLIIGFLLLVFFPLRGEKLERVKNEIKKIYDKRLEI
jgi:GPH family glycoside/pentoside/hexuronide:cation symporter